MKPWAGSKRTRFADREEAGRVLADALQSQVRQYPVVLGLSRGGVPVACVVAAALGAPLGVLVALKLRVPGQPERAAGAVAPGVSWFLKEVVRELAISDDYLRIAAAELERELAERSRAFREWPIPDLAHRDVLIVDDGIASGATVVAAMQSVRQSGARRVTVAAPVAAREGLEQVRSADEVIVPFVSAELTTVSAAYDDFAQLADEDVIDALRTIALRKAQRTLAGSGM